MSSSIPSGPCYITNVEGGTAMDLRADGDIYSNGVQVWGWTLHVRENQQWIITRKDSGRYTVKNRAGGTYLGFVPGGQAQGTKNLTCSSNQVEYNIEGNEWDGWQFVEPRTGLAIDLSAGDSKNENTITWWTKQESGNQRWLIKPLVDPGRLFDDFANSEHLGPPVRFRNHSSGEFIEATSDDKLTGAPALNREEQRWVIERGTHGYRIRLANGSKKYLQRGDQFTMRLATESSTEVLFEGDEEHGYFILLVDDPCRALLLKNEDSGNRKLVRDDGLRIQRWKMLRFNY